MAETGHKHSGRVRTFFVLAFVTVVLAILLLQTWPAVVDTTRGGSGADGRIGVAMSAVPVPAASSTTTGGR
jgi:hypothetical protein